MSSKQTRQHETSPQELTNSDFVIAPGEVMIANFFGFNEVGQALVEFRGFNATPKVRAALTTVSLEQSDSGRQVVVMFVNQDPSQPVVTGLVRSPLYDILETSEPSILEQTMLKQNSPDIEVDSIGGLEQQLTVDGKKVLIEGTEEIALKCGESSITLTKSGKILIRGKYLLNRSSGVNRIMGGSVQVN